MTRRVALAVNPTAGRGRGAAAGAAVTRRLARAGVDVVPVPGTDAGTILASARALLAARADTLVTVGGDGMTHLGVNAVAGTGAALGVVPAGTGNDVARDLGLATTDVEAAAADLVDALAAGRTRAVDAARCPDVDGPGRDRWFLGVLGAGFDALVNERANRWRRPRGHRRYDLAILRELPVLRPRDYELDLDGERWSTRAVLVVVANGTSYGGGMRICPEARMDDGLLDVLVVRPVSRTAFLRIYPRVYAATHLTDPRVTVRRARRVRVAAAGIVGYADGERLAPLPLTCEIVPGAVTVLVPPGRTGAALGRAAGRADESGA